jgi:hypothetical protein
MKGFREGFSKEFIILIAVLVGAGFLRFYSLGHPFIRNTEVSILLPSLRLAQTSPFQFSPLAANFFAQIFSYQEGFASAALPFFFYGLLSALGIALRESVLILPSTLSAMATLVLVYIVGRRLFSPGAGLFAAALMAVLPEAVAHARSVSWVSYSVLAQSLTVLAFLGYFERPTRGRAFLASAALTLELGANSTFPFTVAAVGVLGLLTLPKEKGLFASPLRVLRQLSRPAVWILPAGAFAAYVIVFFMAASRGLSVGFLQRILGKPVEGGFGPYGDIFWGAVSPAFTPLVCFVLGGALLYVLFRFRARPLLIFPAVWLVLVAGASLFFVQGLSRWHVYLMALPAVLLLGAVISDLASLRGEVFSFARTSVRWVAGGLASLLILSGLTYVMAENFRVDPLGLGLRPWFGTVGFGDRNQAIKTVSYYLRKFTPPESIPLTLGWIYERSLVAQLYFGRGNLQGKTGPALFLSLGDLQERGADYVVIFEDGHLLTAAEREQKTGLERLTTEWGMKPVARVRDGETVLAVIYGNEGEVRDLETKIYDRLFDQEFATIRQWVPDYYIGGFAM